MILFLKQLRCTSAESLDSEGMLEFFDMISRHFSSELTEDEAAYVAERLADL